MIVQLHLMKHPYGGHRKEQAPGQARMQTRHKPAPPSLGLCCGELNRYLGGDSGELLGEGGRAWAGGEQEGGTQYVCIHQSLGL